MNDRYLAYAENLRRLQEEYEKYECLYVAFDFDNTVFDYHQVGDTFPRVEQALKRSKTQGIKLILFTANEGTKLDEAIAYCSERGFTPDYVNESPVMQTRKPFYNLLLDDRAGLNEALNLLEEVLNNQTNENKI